jgi:hypothetical protein
METIARRLEGLAHERSLAPVFMEEIRRCVEAQDLAKFIEAVDYTLAALREKRLASLQTSEGGF